MTTATAPSLWDLPTGSLPNIHTDGTYYGVRLADIGEDGDVIALGHVGTHRMIAALRRHAREFYGLRHQYATTTVAEMTDSIAHIWMVNTGPADEWLLERTDPSAPGAFPVTYMTA